MDPLALPLNSRNQTWDSPIPDIRHGEPPSPSPSRHQTSGGHHWRPVQTCLLEEPHPQPPLLTSGGHQNTQDWPSKHTRLAIKTHTIGHQNTHDWQAGGTHTTRMLSCDNLLFFLFSGQPTEIGTAHMKVLVAWLFQGLQGCYFYSHFRFCLYIESINLMVTYLCSIFYLLYR